MGAGRPCAAYYAGPSSRQPSPVGPSTGPVGSSPAAEEGGQGTASGSDSCDPNYEGACLDPDAEDYDCEGGRGNGPRFVRGPLEVVGDDRFGLDTDDPDNIACEESSAADSGGGGGDSDDDTPSGGVESGYGPVAPTREADAPVPFALVGAVIGVLVLAGVGVRLRRG